MEEEFATGSGFQAARGGTAGGVTGPIDSAHCYILFEQSDTHACERLANVAEQLRSDLATGTEIDEAKILTLFEQVDLDRFWWPSDAELQEWFEFAQKCDPEVRASSEMPHPFWDLASVIEVIGSSEYELIGVRPVGDRKAVLEFSPFAYPFGGTESLRYLIAGFGHRIIGFDDGTGYLEGDYFPQTRWKPGMEPVRSKPSQH